MKSKLIHAVHGLKKIKQDAKEELRLANALQREFSRESLLALYGKYVCGLSEYDQMMRRVVFRVLVRSSGDGLQIMDQVSFRHPETFTFGKGVFVGAQAYLQGRFDGAFVVGDRVWIGPQSYFDARNLILEDDVGWGPGAKVLGAVHTGKPRSKPVIQTDLSVKPVRVKKGADIGVNAVILPGVTVGKGAIVGAGAVVTCDVPDYAVVAGVPAKVLRIRD